MPFKISVESFHLCDRWCGTELWYAFDPVLTELNHDIHDMVKITIFLNWYKARNDRNAFSNKCSIICDVMKPILVSFWIKRTDLQIKHNLC